MSARGPVARLYSDGGGVVTRCSDPVEARRLLLELEDDAYDDADLAAAFPIERAIVTRGRIVHCLPGSYGDGEGWSWQFHPGNGRGSTPAVEWPSR
jgi:hypothetical protein